MDEIFVTLPDGNAVRVGINQIMSKGLSSDGRLTLTISSRDGGIRELPNVVFIRYPNLEIFDKVQQLT